MISNVAAADFALHLLLAAVWTLSGRTILGFTRQRSLGVPGWLLAPIVAQAVVAVALGMSAVLGAPIRTVAAGLWLVILGLAAADLVLELISYARKSADAAPTSGVALLAFTAVVVPAIVLLPYFVHGYGTYAGTTHPDAWSYTVFSAYLWEYPRLTEGGLAPAYQWAANLSGTRFVASAELGLLAQATSEGDTQAAFGLLLTLSTFLIGSSCAAIGYVMGLRNGLLLLVAIGGGAGNWIANAIWASNLDNLLALSYLPALATLGLDDAPTVPRGRAVLIGLLAAGAIYTYPEFALLCLACSAPYFTSSLFTRPVSRSLIGIATCALTTGILVWPYAADLLQFMQNQLAAGVWTSARPAEGLFGGLLDPSHRLAALWALGPEDPARPAGSLTRAAAAALSGLAIVGLVRLVRNRALPQLTTLALLIAGFSVFAWRFSYSYGAYKFILLGWWLVVIAVVYGVRELSRLHPVATGPVALLAAGMFAVSLNRSIDAASTPPLPDIAAYRALRAVDQVAPGQPVAIAVADSVATHWATYFLRDSKTRLVTSTGYLAAPYFQPSMARATAIPWDGLSLLLTEALDSGPFVERQHWKRLWGNSQFVLWDTGAAGWAVIWKVDNGYPYAVGPNLVWVADKPVTMVATANAAGIARVNADLGLSQALPADLRPVRLLLADGAGAKCEWRLPDGSSSLVLGLRAGENVLIVTKTSPLGVELAPGADRRFPFMVGLVRPTVEFTRGSPDALSYCPQR